MIYENVGVRNKYVVPYSHLKWIACYSSHPSHIFFAVFLRRKRGAAKNTDCFSGLESTSSENTLSLNGRFSDAQSFVHINFLAGCLVRLPVRSLGGGGACETLFPRKL